MHFSFIPRLACAESDYNTLNLQEHKALQSALRGLRTCVLRLFPATITPAPESAPACRSHSDSPSLLSPCCKMKSGWSSPPLLRAAARAGEAACSARMSCPTFPGLVCFCTTGLLQQIGEVGVVAFQPAFWDAS